MARRLAENVCGHFPPKAEKVSIFSAFCDFCSYRLFLCFSHKISNFLLEKPLRFSLFKMPNFREMKLCILHAYRRRFINDREFVLLYDTSKNPDFPYWNYDRFELDLLTDDECKAQFRFYRDDIWIMSRYLKCYKLCRINQTLYFTSGFQ